MQHEATTPGQDPALLIDTDRPFCVGAWRVEPRAHQVEGPEGVHRLTPKAMQVLCCLAATPGQVGTKEELLETVWAGTVVTESVVPRAISEIRRTLGDDASDPHLIETIPTVGYRLIAPVTVVHPAANKAPQEQQRPAQVPERRGWWQHRRMVLVLLGGFILVELVGIVLWQRRGDVTVEMKDFVTLTAHVGEEVALRASPDGRQVAFIEQGEDEQQFDLYVHPREMRAPFRLTDTPERERTLAWSPDSRSIGFVQTSATTCGLYTISATGGKAQHIAGCEPGLCYHVQWSQDGEWLILFEYAPEHKPARITMLPVPDRPRHDPATSLLLMVH
ncbi:MAG TPA: winged helix-turn-helix domain-containing protein [Rhodothermales bacterium]|nr:winged helix-turn-helix domain-containing protein [Rhodothermales bacterium]